MRTPPRSVVNYHRSADPLEPLESRILFSLPPGLNGSGVPVAQVEAQTGPGQFEVNPSAVNQPASLFTYTSAAGSVAGVPPPNAAGNESGHADAVGQIFYGNGTSIAPGVSHVDNYDADYFINNIIANLAPIPAKVINQSFVATDQNGTPVEDPPTDQAYDNYIALYNKVIVSSAGNGGLPDSPSTAYNDISVGSSDATESVGPTADGRSKPDISAQGGVTSYTAPQVSAAAAVLLQAAQQDVPPWDTAGASDERTIKALLLNAADKPAGWTHTATAPLDPRYGAGVVDAANSVQQLESADASAEVPSWSPVGGLHAPSKNLSGPLGDILSGWNFAMITSSYAQDAVHNYLFNVSGSSTLTATLVWNRQFNQSAINNLDLYLYNVDTRALVAQSVSSVDNVEELYLTGLPAGHYDVEVLKHGGTPGKTAGDVSNTEQYSLAFNFAQAASNPSAVQARVSLGTMPTTPATATLQATHGSTVIHYVPATGFVTVPGKSARAASTSVGTPPSPPAAKPAPLQGTGARPSRLGSSLSGVLLASKLN